MNKVKSIQFSKENATFMGYDEGSFSKREISNILPVLAAWAKNEKLECWDVDKKEFVMKTIE